MIFHVPPFSHLDMAKHRGLVAYRMNQYCSLLALNHYQSESARERAPAPRVRLI